MQIVENATYHEGEQIECSGKSFRNCSFQGDCVLMLSAPGEVDFRSCRFGRRVVVRAPEVGATERVASSHPTPPDGGSL